MLHDVKLFNYELFALWTMRDALEHPLADSVAQTKRHNEPTMCSIPAAVRLVEVAGQLMYSWDHGFEHSALAASGSGGPLWGGKHGFCRERWDLWHQRFDALSIEDWLDGRYRTEAKKAADAMLAIEQGP